MLLISDFFNEKAQIHLQKLKKIKDLLFSKKNDKNLI